MNEISLPYINRQQKLNQLSSLLNQPWAMLLDSAGNDVNYNRYDIFCCQPSVKFTATDGQINIESQLELPELSAEDKKQPLKCLRLILAHLKPEATSQTAGVSSEERPFNGGWMGYISYDFARSLETLPDIAKDDILLPQIQMGLYQWALITDHLKKTTQLINFSLSQNRWAQIVALFDSHKLQPENPEQFKLSSAWQSNTSALEYQQAFQKINDYIHNGDCYQVNFAQRFTADYTGPILEAYKLLSEANRSPFSAYLNFSDHQILSLSPERFIESHKTQVKTQPIKGTRPRSNDPEQDKIEAEALKNSEKDKAENLMIVDLLRNDLSRTASKGSVKVSELFGHYQFASVHHLISTIESRLEDGLDNFDLLATTLPGGSITGAPKIRAMEIIEELEPVRRNIYCGIIGYIDFDGNMDTNICIRTLIAKNQQLHCWAGGGLVADSLVDREYQETFDKLAKILPILEVKN